MKTFFLGLMPLVVLYPPPSFVSTPVPIFGSMAALAMIAKNDQERKQVASGVYSLMKSEYDAVGGGIIMTGGTVALGVLGTQDAYAKLERFLTDDTIPSTAGNVWEGINSPIKSSTQNSYKASRKDGRYLNRINEKFLYLDKQEAKKQGFSTTAWQSPAIQYPYANTLEDVGVLLGQQSAENGAAKRLATKIVQQANQYAKNGEQMAADVHYPVVVGIMDGWRQINHSMNIPSKELITLLYKGNWFDINEGTQRRVHRKAYEFGLRRNMVFDPPVKNKQKVQDYMTYAKAETAASVADVVAQFVLLDMVITKLPALAKGIPNAVRFLKQRSTWVGTKNFIRKLPRTSSVQKAKAGTQAIAKQPVKASATPKATSSAKPKVSQQAAKPRGSAQQPRQTIQAQTGTQPAPSANAPAPSQAAASATENAGAPARAVKPQTPAAEPGTSAVSPTQLQQQVTGPLAKRVEQAKQMPTPYAQRSLLPKTKAELPAKTLPERADGLVYAEIHPSQPNTAVLYYADDMGNVTKTKEIPLAQYKQMTQGMSETDKAILNRRAQLHMDDITKLRQEREYDEAIKIQKRLNEIKQEVERANRSTKSLSETEFKAQQAHMRELQEEQKLLQAQINRTVKDMSRNGFGNEKTIRQVIEHSSQIPATSMQTGGVSGLRYADRSLMPTTRQSVPRGTMPDRADGLVYAERHASDPTKAVLYYADDAGKISTREVPLAQYQKLEQSMSEVDKAILQRRAQLHADDVSKLRQEREYDRMIQMQTRVNQIKQEVELANRSAEPLSEAEFKAEHARMRALQQEQHNLERQINRGIDDMVHNGFSSRGAVRSTIEQSAELPPVPPAPQSTGLVRYAERSLMPQTPKKAGSADMIASDSTEQLVAVEQDLRNPNNTILYFTDKSGKLVTRDVPFTRQSAWKNRQALDLDHMVYAEAHPTDPNRAVLYYADDAGKVTAREVSNESYQQALSTWTDTEKAVANRRAQLHMDDVNKLRQEREYNQVISMQTRINQIQQEVELANRSAKPLSEAEFKAQHAHIKAIQQEQKQLQKQVNQAVKDMSRNGFGKEKDIKQVIDYSAELPPVATPAPTTAFPAYAQRSLLPVTRQKIPRGMLPERADGLVYAEKCAGDPAKAVLYYADDAGKVTAREVPLAQYQKLEQSMSEVDKAILQRRAQLHQDEIAPLRKEREFERVTALQTRVNQINQQLQAANRSAKSLSEAEFKAQQAHMAALQKQRDELAREIVRSIDDMASNGFGSKTAIRTVIEHGA